jgi:ribosomal protein S18 acetylase RimI-like enzyme
MSYTIRTLSKEGLSLLKPLWEKLNEIHLHDSPHFKNFYEAFTFEKRIVSFDTIMPDNMLIQIVEHEGEICGYCISAITNETGEIESLYLEEKTRGKGLGETLCSNAIEWMKKRACKKIQVSVSYGHEEVFGFYEKLGFYPRMTMLQLK